MTVFSCMGLIHKESLKKAALSSYGQLIYALINCYKTSYTISIVSLYLFCYYLLNQSDFLSYFYCLL